MCMRAVGRALRALPSRQPNVTANTRQGKPRNIQQARAIHLHAVGCRHCNIMDMEEAVQSQQAEEQQQELVDQTMPLEVLVEQGIQQGDIKKLQDAGIWTVGSLAGASKRELVAIKGLSEAKVEKLQKIAWDIIPMGFSSALQLLEQRQDVIKISTGAQQLDQILQGGFETGTITELYGEFRTGKTQLCHTLCVSCQLPVHMGGGEGKAMYIDTEGTFRPERVQQIADRFGLSSNDVLENVCVARAANTEHQQKLLMEAAQHLAECRYSLVVVDSATALFRTEYSGRGQLSERQISLGKFMRALQRISEQFGVAVVVTNQVVASNLDGAGGMFAGPQLKPIGGNIMAHASTTRIHLKKGRGETRVAKVISSPSLPEADATFMITGEGIGDAKD